jgi:hypothetical protein
MRTACATAGYSRFGTCLLSVLLAAAGVAGCAGMETAAPLPLITLGLEEGARWIEPHDLPRYQCEQGSLVCTSAIGRLTSRLCRCVDAPANERPLAGSPYSSGANAP